ncbi:MAG: hypothetical protein IJJ71_04370 [Treponema sp.]|uniref:host specificity factor TipJ family phage tail protein n=1 Tax=Treponema sp. TaxID=166 RepID=UPI0025EA243B|nr:host specificity factor TipJ family phage tail protein [Treponema sp.]MBR0495396.1 hypothetical protein [Treponema sp.]
MSIQVTAFLNPFSQKKSEFHFEEAISIQEIIKKFDALHAVNTGWRVLIDDEIVTDFTRIPEDGQHVFIKLVPEGDNKSTGTGMKVGGALAVVGGIAAIAFLGWTGIGGAAGAALIGIGIGCFAGGTVLYNLNIEVPSLSQNKKQQAPEQDPAIRGSENQLRPYGMIPTLFGKRRIYSDLAATSYTWAEDGAIYLYQLFCAGQKDMEIDTGSIKIDETLITQYSSTGDINKILSGQDPLIDMRIHQDGTMPLLYDKCVHEEQINAILKHETEEGIDGSVIRTTPEGTQEINVDLFFFNGLGKYNNNGGLETTSVEVGAWYKRSDEPDSAYKLLRNPISAQNKTQFFHVSLPWGIQVTRSTLFARMADWSYLSGDRFDVDPAKAPEYQVQILSVYDPCPSARSIIPPAQIVDFSIGFSVSGSTNIVIEGAELKTKRYSITKLGLSPASYTVKISRLTADGTDMNVIDDVYVGSIRAAKNVNPIRPERAAQLTLVELKIKASAKLNNVVKKLNFVAQSKLPSYLGDGSGSPRWSDRLSSNPASAAIYAMQGGFAQQQLSDGEIDWPMFERLYIWCAANGYECNAYLTEQIPISSLLSSIASTCRAEIFRLNGKITVIQDITRDSFTQLFTPRNSHGYSEQIALATIPDALSLSFVDKQNGYAENFTRVYNTPNGNYAGEPHTTQEIQLWGVTDSKQARKIGMYDYAVSKHRFIIHKFSCDFEYLMCSKGDWIKYAGDIAIAGVTQGRITERIFDGNGLVAGFECDEIIPMESGKSYGMRVRKANGESELFYLVNTGSSSRSVYLQNPIIVQNIPQNNESKAGDLFTFGEVSGANLKDAIDLIVTDIQCGENLSADLTCVEYAPEIFGVDDPNFVLPEFENNLSEKSFVIDMGDVSEWRTFTTYNDSKEKPSRPEGDGTQDGWHYVQTENSFWISTKTASTVSDGVWSEPMPSGQLAFERLLSGDTDIGTPDSVAGLTAIAREKDILITWNPASEDGLKNTIKYYSVEISRDGGEHWSNAADTNKDSLTYPFDRNIVGYPESDEVSTWFVRARAVNVYGNASETWSVTAVNTSSYGTWIPAASNFTMKEADEGGINLAWSIARGTGGKELYGSTTYRIIVKYEDEIRAIIETDSRVAVYNFNRSLDHFPEKPDVAGAAVTLDKFKVSVEAINESGNTALGTDKFIDYDNYKTWIPRQLEGEYAVRQNAARRAVTLLFPPQGESIYGSVVFGITISRRNTDKDGNMQIFYTPNITKDCYSDINSYKDTSTNAVFCSSSFKQNLPLIGQDMRTIQLDRYDVEWRDGEPVKDSAENIERYAISREYYVYDSDGIQSFRSVYGVHSAINLDSILESLENNMTVTDYTWTREGGSDSNYTVCHMTLSLIQTPMPEDTEYIYKCFAKT